MLLGRDARWLPDGGGYEYDGTPQVWDPTWGITDPAWRMREAGAVVHTITDPEISHSPRRFIDQCRRLGWRLRMPDDEAQHRYEAAKRNYDGLLHRVILRGGAPIQAVPYMSQFAATLVRNVKEWNENTGGAPWIQTRGEQAWWLEAEAEWQASRNCRIACRAWLAQQQANQQLEQDLRYANFIVDEAGM